MLGNKSDIYEIIKLNPESDRFETCLRKDQENSFQDSVTLFNDILNGEDLLTNSNFLEQTVRSQILYLKKPKANSVSNILRHEESKLVDINRERQFEKQYKVLICSEHKELRDRVDHAFLEKDRFHIEYASNGFEVFTKVRNLLMSSH